MSDSWYLIQTKTGQEILAEVNMRRQGYHTFLPRAYRTLKHARRVRVETPAYFPGYLFVRFDPEVDRWRNISHTVGVIRLVTGLDRPLRVPFGLVEMLQGRCDERGVLDQANELKVGDAIKVVYGPLADQIGLIDRLVGVERVRVLISILNAELPVQLDRRACAAA